MAGELHAANMIAVMRRRENVADVLQRAIPAQMAAHFRHKTQFSRRCMYGHGCSSASLAQMELGD